MTRLSILLAVTVVTLVSAWSSDDQALLRAIEAHPDEDTPRLMYADWLEEHGGTKGGERARFIRLQMDLARRTDTTSRDYVEKSQQADTLLQNNFAEWTPVPLQATAQFGAKEVSVAVWRRGFIERVRLDFRVLRSPETRKAIDELPGLLGIEVGMMSDESIDRLATLKALRRVKFFGAYFPIGDRWGALLPELQSIEDLHLEVEHAPAISAFLQSRAAARLKRLSIDFLPTSDHGYGLQEHLMTSPWLTHLETLILNGRGLGFNLSSSALTGLSSSQNLPRLKNVRLVTETGADIRAFIRTPRFQQLTQFSVAVGREFPNELIEEVVLRGPHLVDVLIQVGLRQVPLPAELARLIAKNRSEQTCAEVVSAFAYD